MNEATAELGKAETFKGYGPEIGYDFLKEKIKEYDYKQKGIDIDISEIFISDGIKLQLQTQFILYILIQM